MSKPLRAPSEDEIEDYADLEEMDPEEREALVRSLAVSDEELAGGEGVDADEVLEQLRLRHA